jgi:hypothetical protein
MRKGLLEFSKQGQGSEHSLSVAWNTQTACYTELPSANFQRISLFSKFFSCVLKDLVMVQLYSTPRMLRSWPILRLRGDVARGSSSDWPDTSASSFIIHGQVRRHLIFRNAGKDGLKDPCPRI